MYNQFLDLVSVMDGKADTIVSAVKTVLLKKGIPTEKLYGLGTDGVAVMTGNYFMQYDLVYGIIFCLLNSSLKLLFF